MPALNFTMFVDKVEDGTKRCTIRARRKRPIKAGEMLQLYTGMRHKGCRKLRPDQLCLSTTPVVIHGDRVLLGDDDLTADEIADLAHRDGFSCGAVFLVYFNHDGRFEGDLITW